MYFYLVTKKFYTQEQNYFESHLLTLKWEGKLLMIPAVPSKSVSNSVIFVPSNQALPLVPNFICCVEPMTFCGCLSSA